MARGWRVRANWSTVEDLILRRGRKSTYNLTASDVIIYYVTSQISQAKFKLITVTLYLERLSECRKPSPLYFSSNTPLHPPNYVWFWRLCVNFWGSAGVARFCSIVYLLSDGNHVSKGRYYNMRVYNCPTSHSLSSPARNPIWNEIPRLKITSLKVYLSLMTFQTNVQSNSEQRRSIQIGHRFRRGWMEQVIGDQLLAHYGKRENGLFSMFTPTYDHITSYKSPDSKFPDSRRVYSTKQFIYIYSIKRIFVKLIPPSSIDEIALAYFA